MPEGDTVRRTAVRLDQALSGRQLVRAELRWPTLGQHDLAAATVLETVAYGKHLLTRLESPGWRVAMTLHSHLRMDGSWRIQPTATPWPAPGRAEVRAVLGTGEWTAVGVLLGDLDLVPTSAEHQLIGHLGPDILAPDFDTAEWGLTQALSRLAARPDIAIGAALLDQRNLAGIGTFYLSESLFVLGVNPWTAVGQVGDLRTVVDRARRMLAANLERATPTTTGDLRDGRRSWVHPRSGRPCRRCGSTIRVAPLEVLPRSPGQTAGLSRVIFYCPSCQGGLAPTDDGGPQGPLGSGSARSDRRGG